MATPPAIAERLEDKRPQAGSDRALSSDMAYLLEYDWSVWARPDQLPPAGDWSIWLVEGGRGAGKSRTGAEFCRAKAFDMPGSRGAFIAPTAADARDIMVEGESGILNVSPPDFYPRYEPSKRRLTWPNGTVATIFSADEPGRLNGPQHHWLWADEIGVWNRPRQAWDMAMFGLRLGDRPQGCVTFTPKPIRLVGELLKMARENEDVVLSHATTYANRGFLAPTFFSQIVARYEGTRLGRQELAGQYLEDVPGALWNLAMLDQLRRDKVPDLERIVVAIDPAVTSGDEADETGIIVAGRDEQDPPHGYLLADLTKHPASPKQWAEVAVRAYHDHHADRIVGEVNNGGDLVETVIRMIDPAVSYKAVRASRGKMVRAEPVAALYEKRRVHHIGTFEALEDQLVAMTTGAYGGVGSPDRLDAAVWAFTELLIDPDPEPRIRRL